VTTRFKYTLAGAALWASLVKHQIIVANKDPRLAIEQAKAAVLDYQRRKRDHRFDSDAELYSDE